MDLEKANKKLELTDEELKALENYTGPGLHTRVNTICYLDQNTYKDMSGWNIPKTKEEVESTIDSFVNVYSGALKKSFTDGNIHPNRLYRGTSRYIANSLHKGKKINQFYSTSTDRNVAKQFRHAMEDKALFEMYVPDDVPVVDMNYFHGESGQDEEEYMLLPFFEIEEVHSYDDPTEGRICNVTVKQRELEEISQEEASNLRESIISSYEQHIKNIQECDELVGRYEGNAERIKAAAKINDHQEIEYIYNVNREISEKIHEYETRIEEYNSNMQRYLEGMCKQKQLEIKECEQVIEEDKKAKIEIERKNNEEKNRRNKADMYNGLINSSISKADNLVEKMNNIGDRMSKVDYEFREKYEKLGINSIEKDENLGDIVRNIDDISTKTNNLSSSLVNEKVDLDNIDHKKIYYNEGSMTSLNVDMQDCNNYVPQMEEDEKEYSNLRELELKEAVYNKAMNLIKNSKIEQYKAQREGLENTKLSLLDRIRGKGKLLEVEKKNIELKLEQEEKREIEQKQLTEYSIRDIASDLYIEINHVSGPENSEEMQKFYEQIKQCYKVGDKQLDDEMIRKYSENKLQKDNSRLPYIQNSKESMKNRILRLNEENEKMESAQNVAPKEKIVNQSSKEVSSRILQSVLAVENVIDNCEYAQSIELERDKTEKNKEIGDNN